MRGLGGRGERVYSYAGAGGAGYGRWSKHDKVFINWGRCILLARDAGSGLNNAVNVLQARLHAQAALAQALSRLFWLVLVRCGVSAVVACRCGTWGKLP